MLRLKYYSFLFLLIAGCGSSYKSTYSINGIDFKFPDEPKAVATHNELDFSLGVHEASYNKDGFIYHVSAREYDKGGDQQDWAKLLGSHMPGRDQFLWLADNDVAINGKSGNDDYLIHLYFYKSWLYRISVYGSGELDDRMHEFNPLWNKSKSTFGTK